MDPSKDTAVGFALGTVLGRSLCDAVCECVVYFEVALGTLLGVALGRSLREGVSVAFPLDVLPETEQGGLLGIIPRDHCDGIVNLGVLLRMVQGDAVAVLLGKFLM